MTDQPQSVGGALIAAIKRHLIDISVPRIDKCLSHLTDDEIWHRPNDETVSIGNLVLHLCGNIGQHIVAGFGDAEDVRVRQQEFDERGPIPRAELLDRLHQTMNAAGATLDALDPDSLLETRRIQGDAVTGVAALVHVVEHFSYHVGQIGYYVKARKSVDLGYYAGQDLGVTGKN